MGGSYQWPSLAEVLEYRRQVREMVIDVIENAPLEFPITQESPWVILGDLIVLYMYCNTIYAHLQWSLLMGIEHERFVFVQFSVYLKASNITLI